MEYRVIGNTGMEAGVIGLGCEHLDGKPYAVVEETINAAMDAGANIMDVFMPGAEVRGNIGRALKGRRDKWLIQGHIGSVDLKQQYDISRDLPTCKLYFEDLLKQLGTDYIDFGMLFFLDSEDAWNTVRDGGILDYAQSLKQRGIVRALGASSHNPLVAAQVVQSGVVDLLMFSINPAFDRAPSGQNVLASFDDDFANSRLDGTDPARATLYRLCESKGVGITVMKTLGGGRLLNADHSPFGRALTVGQCIHYALGRPGVVSALVGCVGEQQVQQAMAYLDMSQEERDYTGVLATAPAGGAAGCMYCNHCLPCPAGIDIAYLTRQLDIAALTPGVVPPSVRMHYGAMEHHAGECIECRSCEGKCPFGIQVVDNMRQAARIFGK